MSPAALFNEFTIVIEGNALSYVIYGVYVVIAGTNLVLLRRRKNNILLLFTLFQLVVTTLYNAIQLYGSPLQFLTMFGVFGADVAQSLSLWPNAFISAAYVVNTWSSDAFLLYRCYVVCMGDKYATAFPALLYLAVVGSSLAYLYVSMAPGAVYSTAAVRATAMSYWSCSVALNVVASFVISVRLLLHRRAISRAIGAQHGAFYLSYMAMTLESAMLYTACGIAALVAFSLNSPLEAVFFTILGPVQVLAPALIVNRIARGVSFDTDEHGTVVSSSLRCVAPSRPHVAVRSTDRDVWGSSNVPLIKTQRRDS